MEISRVPTREARRAINWELSRLDNSDLECPGCHRTDEVGHVPLIANSPSPHSAFLAERLSPPRRPGVRSPWEIWEVLVVTLLILGLVVALITTEDNVSNLSLAGVAGDPLITYLVLSTLVFLLPVGFLVARNEKQRLVSRQTSSMLVEEWERAMARWESLYYCERCDGVFTRGMLHLTPATEMMGFIHQSAAAPDPARR